MEPRLKWNKIILAAEIILAAKIILFHLIVSYEVK